MRFFIKSAMVSKLTSIHLPVEELDLGHRDWLSFVLREAIALVVGFRSVYWIDL